jgi:hypothetical protein
MVDTLISELTLESRQIDSKEVETININRCFNDTTHQQQQQQQQKFSIFAFCMKTLEICLETIHSINSKKIENEIALYNPLINIVYNLIDILARSSDEWSFSQTNKIEMINNLLEKINFNLKSLMTNKQQNETNRIIYIFHVFLLEKILNMMRLNFKVSKIPTSKKKRNKIKTKIFIK